MPGLRSADNESIFVCENKLQAKNKKNKTAQIELLPIIKIKRL